MFNYIFFFFIFLGFSTSSTWCQLAYWELAQRVGGRFPVENPSVNVFSDQLQGDGMCLKTLTDQRQSKVPESVLKARQKIGLGKKRKKKK